MLGRTDSRRRLLFLLLVFAVGSLALVTRTAYWQVLRGEELTAWAGEQTSVRIEIGGRRGDIYDRSGTVLLATSVARDRLVAAADKLTPDQRARTADALVRLLGLDEAGAADLRTKLASDKPYVILARGIKPEIAERIRQAANAKQVVGLSLEPEPERVYPQAGGGPDSTLAAHLLGFVNRENIGQYGVEQFYQQELAGSPRVLIAQRDASGRARSETSVVQEPGTLGEDMRLTIDAGLQLGPRAGAPGGLDRGRRQERVGGRDGSVHRRGLRRGHVSVVRRQRLPSDRGQSARTLHRPGRVERLRAGLGVQDDDRDDGPGSRHGHAGRRGSRTSARCGWTAAERRSTTPTARAWAGSRSRTASPTRATSSPPRSPSSSTTRPPVPRRCCTTRGASSATARRPASMSPARSRASCATRPSSRGARSTSRTAPSARASR